MSDVRNGSGETQSLELWAAAEVRRALDWSTRRHMQLARASGAFPEPRWVVAGGTVEIWDAADVRKWAAEHLPPESRPAWRRAEAVRMYRRGVIQAEISRQLKAKPQSVRTWLRAAGETLPKDRETQAL